MKALSIRAPWWWYILHGGKDIENRSWSTGFRGTLILHASKYWGPDIPGDVVAAEEIAGFTSSDALVSMADSRGCIVGRVDVVDCVTASDSPWFFGRYGFVLANPVPFAHPVPCKGERGLFGIHPAVMDELRQRGDL